MADALLDQGQEMQVRTRRGADLAFSITLTDPDTGDPIDITGATVRSRVFRDDAPDETMVGFVDGPAGIISISLAASRTRNMARDWRYVIAYALAGKTRSLLYGPFFVEQDFVP